MPTIVRGISEDSDSKSRLQIRNQQNKRKSRKSRRKRGQSGNRVIRGQSDHEGCHNGIGCHMSTSTCFGYETLVTTGSGEKKLMRDLRIGDKVLSDETGSLTEFLGWLELNSKEKIWFLEIQTEDGEKLIMTETHIVFHYEDGKPSPTYIRNLRPGNVLVGGSGEVLTLVCKYAI